jgi:hypothetical protein
MLASGAHLIRGGDVGFATRVGPKVQTLLGLSMTSTSVGWVLLDGQCPDAAILDHDSFDVQSGAKGAAWDTSAHAAAARGAQAIAAASGHKVGSVQVTWTEDVEDAATTFLKSLADLGFDNVHAIPLSEAAKAWGIEVGRETGHTSTGLCILEPDEAMIMVVATGAGSVRTAITDTRETAEDLVEWLRTVFRKDGWLPESLYLIGALADLDEVTQPIAEALPIPVSDSVDTRLALARGAALVNAEEVMDSSAKTAERPWRVSVPKKSADSAAAETVVAPAVSQVDTVATPAIETPRVELHIDRPGSDGPWLVSHAKKVTVSAAAVTVFGAALLLAGGSALNVENASTQAANPLAADASMTSASVHTVPAPAPAPPARQAQPRAAGPPPAPPATTLALPAEPRAVVAPERVAAPVPRPTISASPPANVSAATPTVAPPAPHLAAPVPSPAAPFAAVGPPPGPLAPPALGPPPGPFVAPALGPPPGPPVAPALGPPPGPFVAPALGPPPGPPVAPALGPPPGPPVAPAVNPPAAPLLEPAVGPPVVPIAAPLVAPPAAPEVVPPAAAPAAQPPGAAPEPADAPPPPDPIQAILGTMFSGQP